MSAPVPAPPVVIDRLTKRYGDTVAVDDLSFTVQPGRVTGFLGPNGAGKTTTMRCLLGLASPTHGRALIGEDRYAQLAEPARTVGALVDGAEMHPARTGRKALRIRAVAAGVPDARVEAVLGMVGMTGAADRRVGGYSLGMRQRLGLAAALLGEPPVLVLDEPANGLDPEGIRWIREFLRGQADAGRTVFVSSHLLAEVSRLADEVVVISHGRLVAHRPVGALTTDGAVVEVRSPTLAALAEILRAAGAQTTITPEGTMTVVGLPVEEVGALAARDRIVLHGLRVRESDLEEAFLGLTGDGEQVGTEAAVDLPREVLR